MGIPPTAKIFAPARILSGFVSTNRTAVSLLVSTVSNTGVLAIPQATDTSFSLSAASGPAIANRNGRYRLERYPPLTRYAPYTT